MKSYDIKMPDGTLFAFEVERGFTLTRRGLVSKLRKISGINIVREPKLFACFDDDEFCEFFMNGVEFVAFEPFGDSSRFWLGPKDREVHEETEELKKILSGKR